MATGVEDGSRADEIIDDSSVKAVESKAGSLPSLLGSFKEDHEVRRSWIIAKPIIIR
jgi:hypothetical protein